MMSRTISRKSGSFDDENVATGCGCKAKARYMRLMADRLSQAALAIDRVLQCVAYRGVDANVVVITCSTCASVMRRGAPGRGA